MQKLFSITFFVASIAFLSIIASADEEQSRAWKMTRMDKPLTTTKNRGNPVNLNPDAADAFSYWIPERIRASVPREFFVDGPATSGLGDIPPLLTVPESHWTNGGADQKAAIGRSLQETRSHVVSVEKSPCHGRLCKVDLSMIDPSAKKISFEVGSAGISTIDQSVIEAAATAGLDVTRFKTFRSSGKSMRKGHFNGESGFSYLNLLQQGTGPNGNSLWFGTMYDSDTNIYYDISPDAYGTSIVTYATDGLERPLPTARKFPVSEDSNRSDALMCILLLMSWAITW